MLTLINTNRMTPPIGPIGLDYIAPAVKKGGIDVDIVDLCFADDPDAALRNYFAGHNPALVGISFRNTDDCFWPSAEWFVPGLAATLRKIRELTDAPIVIGGVGFSIFAEQIVDYTGADFGVRGDGEQAILSLLRELSGTRRFERVPGLIWREDSTFRANQPAWPTPLALPTTRESIDNRTYFENGGQCGLETKRGCDRRCIYCADPLAKGHEPRLRDPAEVADEVESLISQGVAVLHTCDCEFNVPRGHAYAVCQELIRRSLGEKIRWYAYMAVTPFDAELAEAMSKAGCVGIDFTGDSASGLMLGTYRQPHLKEDLASAVKLCRANNIKAMIDLLLGGPGETPDTMAETIECVKQIDPDCAGASLGVRIYPGTEMANIVAGEGTAETNPNIRRKYDGPVDLFKPTFYISGHLGPQPARLVKQLIAGDKRFFEPTPEVTDSTEATRQGEGPCRSPTDHNYNDNTELVEAIKKGARGAYWDILRQLRSD